MSFLSKLRKKRTTKIVDIESKKEEQKISTYTFENQNFDNSKAIIGVKGKTFVRLEELEKLLQNQQQTIEALKKQVNELVLNGSPNAKYVLDTYDGQYKNVKDIQINYALNADRVRVPGTSNYIPMNEFRVAHANTTDLALTTKTVQFNGGTYTMDLLMLNYVPSGMLKEGVQFDTYEKFREYINSKIK